MSAELIKSLPSQRMRAMQDRIEALEAAITEALRSRDEDMRDILRKGLHGGEK